VKPTRDRDALTAMLVREGYLPVWLESGLLDAYYNGFCNRYAACRSIVIKQNQNLKLS
jgi:hypothetical protein